MNHLIVGLGNPGNKYSNTRHNIGWMCIENFVRSLDLKWKEKFKAYYSEWSFGDKKVFFLLPQTYMNLSGDSVVPAASFFKIDVPNILVIHDELDLPFGSMAFKSSGGHAGHNGLRSIIASLGKNDFCRLRLGIGRPPHPSYEVSDFVLSSFDELERAHLTDFLNHSKQALTCYLENGIAKASTLYNKKGSKT